MPIVGFAAFGLLLLLLIFIVLMIAIWRRRSQQSKVVDDETPESSMATATTTESGGSSWEDDVTARGSPRVPKQKVTDDVYNAKLSVIGGALSTGSSGSPKTPAAACNAAGPQLPPRSYGVVHRSTGSKPLPKPPAAGGNGQASELLPGSDAVVRKLGPERPQILGPTVSYVYIPPKKQIEPRAYAPASHNVPAAVKQTWGRAKAKQIALQMSLSGQQ